MKLQDINTVFICPDHNEKYQKRKEHMIQLMEEIGIKKYYHYKSSHEGNPIVCLTKSNIDVLKQHLDDEPLLLLEDDINFTGIDSFDIPPYCDAIYVGISMQGGSIIYNCNDGRSTFEPFNENQVKITNMLSTHAILYVSKRYKQAVIKELEKCGDYPFYNDVIMSRMQSKYNIYANKKPSFYQSILFNEGHESVEMETKIMIS